MGIDAGDNQLIAAHLLQDRLQRRAVKCTVAPFGQDLIVLIRCQRIHDLLLIGMFIQARSPHVVEQRTIFIALRIWLSGVKHRNTLRFAVATQAGNIVDYLLNQRAVVAPEVEKIALHIVDQQGGTARLQRPFHFVVGQLGGGWQRIRGQLWNSH